MRRDLRRESSQTPVYPPLQTSRILEAGGLPKAPDPNRITLQRKMAEKLGIIQRAPIDLPSPEKFTSVDMGNKELPVYEYKSTITDSVRDNLITIVVAETGAGKSTQVPQFLLQEGYSVTMTQPRRIAAQMLSEQIDREVIGALGVERGYGYVGFQTARNNTINDRTRISVVTDGLRLVQELNEREQIQDEVLIIDEVHEWNTNMELLIALVKEMTAENPRLRVVIMSATIDSNALASFFTYDDRRPPIIEVPGRTHSVEMTEAPDSDVVMEAIKHVAEDKTVLIFLPGLREIDDTKDQILKLLDAQNLADGVRVLSLHGDMSPAEQEAIGQKYHGPKIICATNVAQTSITIPDVDVVIDSGLERRIMIDKEGTTSLELNTISQADCRQRAGRCGRTHDGKYVLTRYISSEARKKKLDMSKGIFRFTSFDETYNRTTGEGRLEYPIPEILRTNADRSTLAMAAAGLDIKRLDLYHRMDERVLKRSANLLRVLGAFDENNAITRRGLRMSEFPIRPTNARMLTYAEENNFLPETKLYVAAMIAAVEHGGLPNYSFSAGDDWRSLAPEKSSDYLSQMKMFLEIQAIDSMMTVSSMDLNPRKVLDARKTHEKLSRRLHVPLKTLPVEVGPDQLELISDAVVSGMVDFVYRQSGGEYRRTSESLGRRVTQRVLSDRSLVKGNPTYVVGTPYRIPALTNRPEKHILQDVHTTTPEQLAKVALELCTWRDDKTVWRDGRPKVKQQRFFRDTVPIGEWREVDATWTPELREIILREIKQRPGPALRELNAIKKELEGLWNKKPTEVTRIEQDEIDQLLQKLATRKIVSPDQLDNKVREYMLANRMYLDAYVPFETKQRILDESPDYVEWKGLSLQLQYKSGRALLRHVTDRLEAELLERNGELKLPDGRDIYLMRARKQYTLWQLRKQRESQRR